MKITNLKYFKLCVDILFIFIAIFIAIYAKEAFVYYSSAFSYYFFESNRILTTNDAYHFATATRDFIEGNFKNAFYPIATFELPTIFSAFLYYILPISLDNLFFLMPVWISSLIVIPVYFWTKDISNNYVALFAAILAPLIIGYSNRNVAGYYDTDMLILTLPLFGLYFLYRILHKANFRDLLLAIFFFILSLSWHKVSATYILTAGLFIACIYIFVKDRKNLTAYEYIGVLIISISYINIIFKLILLAVLLHFMISKPFILSNITTKIKSKIKYKSILILLIGLGIFIVSNLDLITSRFQTYINDKVAVSSSIVFHSTSGTIMELAPISVSDLVERSIGDKISFIVGLIGILAMFIKHPRTILLLPFLIIAISSLKIGLRFSMFATPIFSMGFFYLIYFLSQFINLALKDKIALNSIKFIFVLTFAIFAILPNYYHTKNYFPPPIAIGDELDAFSAIKEDSNNRKDITISWWDYGFMIPYYSNTMSMIQGTDLDGVNHFLSSFILSSSNQYVSYNMAKLIAQAAYSNDKNIEKLNIVDGILYSYNAQDNPKEFMESLQNLNTPKINENIYIYLPFSILAIQTALDEFSDIDYKTGEVIHKEDTKTLAQYRNIKDNGKSFLLDGQFMFFPDSGVFQNNENKKFVQIQKFSIIERINDELKTTTKVYTNDKSKLNMIYSKELKMFFAIDERTNNSLTVQLFLYENYNKNLFTLIYHNKDSKAYKLK